MLAACLSTIFAVCVAGVASTCLLPRQNWCDTDEIARECGVLEICKRRFQIKNEAERVKLQVYFESYCPDSQRFVTTQLFPTWKELKAIMEIELVPYGKATTSVDADGNYTFVCQHGEKECQGNRIQNCAIKYSNDDPEIYLPFINCMMGAIFPNNAAPMCAANVNLDYSVIADCSNGKEGADLLSKAGEKTQALDPKLSRVPWIVLNGVHTNEIQIASTTNLKKVICDNYEGESPSECTGSL